eukprot:CAMPEP_0181451170 /NCGR_PEP_ID=MMETSP1110-20121109/28551_1 /TAXON_ID=174948 /ORGANISM="Symbiodinium sp., Strain CCMP421" /LENGTH=157 /DNA_ID=CAMNT_0023575409 /DNA_START=29 /DNA_END=501 /DNA_ORIENTATION=-
MMGTVTWAARRMMEVVQTAPDLRQTKDNIVLCHVPASSGAKACPKLSKEMIRRASHTAQEQIPPVPAPGDCLSMDPEASPVSSWQAFGLFRMQHPHVSICSRQLGGLIGELVVYDQQHGLCRRPLFLPGIALEPSASTSFFHRVMRMAQERPSLNCP